ncbi:MAG: T9SS type A sorting domain-containing protein [Flavobacteriales bacterium]|nr:T9SS type A sorting domain-containing protein [Flavobacteriales bacterium]
MKIKALILSFFIAGSTIGQINIDDYKVGNTGIVNDHKLVMDVMENNHPGFSEAVNESFNKAKNQMGIRSGVTLTIPVVVHIVWKNSAENISTQDINDQIDILNRDYARQNADTVNLRSILQPIAGNPNIQFNLVHVERVQTTTDFNLSFTSLYDDIKKSSAGGSDAWNTSNYLNIWVGNLQGGFLLGYAYPPAGLPNWPAGSTPSDPNVDGVVIDYRGFGPNTNLGGQIFHGRTAVHEVGHYLGLRHIWGDGDCTQDDGLNDTPTTDSESQFDCVKTKNTCNDGAGDLPDMVENYMDYSDDQCQNSFTKDQANFMRSVLQNQRSGLLSPASINEVEEVNFSMFPNPANEVVQFKLSGTNSARLTIINLLGEKVYQENLKGALKLDVTSFKRGIYLVKVSSTSGELTKKLVIK